MMPTTHRTRLWALAALLIAMALVMFAAVSQDRAASTPPAYPYEQTVCWQMDAPDLANPASYEWPQTKVDCSAVPPASTTTCDTPAKYQVDTYWIRDDADRDYLAGMNTMSSSADDGSDSPTTRNLEPHGYYAVLVTQKPASECATPTPTSTPTPTPTPTAPPTTAPPTPTAPPTTQPPTSTPPTSTPPKSNPPKTTPPSRRCIDENTIKVTHSDGTVDFIQDHGVCDHKRLPPLIETGL